MDNLSSPPGYGCSARTEDRSDFLGFLCAYFARHCVYDCPLGKVGVMIKVIDSIQYHVWSDALHARELARETKSDWDRGAYVRWAIQTAWSAFENVCIDALAATGLGMRFRERFDEAVAARSLPAVDWGQGIWQRVLRVYGIRKEFVHVVPGISHARLMTPLAEAETAIAVLRDAIKAVSGLVGLPHPAWANDDADRGWDGSRDGFGGTAEAYVVRAGTQENDLDNVRITYVLRGEEHLNEIAPPGTPHDPLLDRLVSSLSIPVEAVRFVRDEVTRRLASFSMNND